MPEILVDFPSMRDYFVFVVVGWWQDSPFCSLLERRSGKTIRKVLFAFARTPEALWDGLCPEGFLFHKPGRHSSWAFLGMKEVMACKDNGSSGCAKSMISIRMRGKEPRK